jgi:hypothetical protein
MLGPVWACFWRKLPDGEIEFTMKRLRSAARAMQRWESMRFKWDASEPVN